MAETPPPSPLLLLDTINAYQRTAAIRAAIEIGLFSAISGSGGTAAEVAARCGAAERGVRILADYMVISGFLVKRSGRYHLTPDTAVFLDQRSPAYMGGTIRFLLSPQLTAGFDQLTDAARAGGSALPPGGTVAADHPIWVEFARAMIPMMAGPAEEIAGLVACPTDRPVRILDVAAGHGLFGIAFAHRYPRAEITAVDWSNVLDVARENALAAGVSGRYRLLPGSAFEVDPGAGYDLVLLTNFLHHFDVPTCESLLRRVHAWLAPGGRAVTLEFVPNDDRVSPPAAASFSLVMLASTPSGDAYTAAELESMFRSAGFSGSASMQLARSVELVMISTR